jgi:hypothetical protein
MRESARTRVRVHVNLRRDHLSKKKEEVVIDSQWILFYSRPIEVATDSNLQDGTGFTREGTLVLHYFKRGFLAHVRPHLEGAPDPRVP